MKRAWLAGAGFLGLLLAPVVLVIVVLKVAPVVCAAWLAGAVDVGGLLDLWGRATLLALVEVPLIALAGFALPPLLGRSGRWQGVLVSLVSLPLLLPDAVEAAVLLSLFGLTPAMLGTSTGAAAVVVVVVESLGYGAAAALLAMLLSRRLGGPPRDPGRPAPETIAVVLVLLARLAFAPAGSIDLAATVSPSILDPPVPAAYTALWPVGAAEGSSFGAPAAAWLIQYGVQLALAVPLGLLARRLVRALPKGTPAVVPSAEPRRLAPFAPTAVAASAWLVVVAVMVVGLVVPALVGFREAVAGLRTRLPEGTIGVSFLRYGLCGVAAALLAWFSAVAVAYPLSRGGRGTRSATAGILLLLLAMPAPGIAHYLQLRSYGMLGSIYPYLLRGVVPVLAVLFLALVRRALPGVAADPVDRREPYAFFFGFLRPMRSELAALSLVLLAGSWGEVGETGLFLSAGPEALWPAAWFRVLVTTSAAVDGTVMLAGLVTSIPALVIAALLPALLRGRARQPPVDAGLTLPS